MGMKHEPGELSHDSLDLLDVSPRPMGGGVDAQGRPVDAAAQLPLLGVGVGSGFRLKRGTLWNSPTPAQVMPMHE